MRAYIATYIYIVLHPEASIGDYWNTDETKGRNNPAIYGEG